MFECAEELREVLRSSGDKQLTELAELLEMQEELDKAILKEQGITRYPQASMEVALFVELGEMLNELPTLFKHWKKTAEDNREKALLEYVDALHFAMSLTNQYAFIITGSASTGLLLDKFKYSGEWPTSNKAFYMVDCIEQISPTQWKIKYLFRIGALLGFTWDEIYKVYKDKNAVNYQRLKEGY